MQFLWFIKDLNHKTSFLHLIAAQKCICKPLSAFVQTEMTDFLTFHIRQLLFPGLSVIEA